MALTNFHGGIMCVCDNNQLVLKIKFREFMYYISFEFFFQSVLLQPLEAALIVRTNYKFYEGTTSVIGHFGRKTS